MIGCNGTCETEARARKLQRAARAQLKLAAPGTETVRLLGFLRALDLLLDEDNWPMKAPAVKAVVQGAVCALPAEGQEPCPS